MGRQRSSRSGSASLHVQSFFLSAGRTGSDRHLSQSTTRTPKPLGSFRPGLQGPAG